MPAGNIAMYDNQEGVWHDLGYPCPASPCYWRIGVPDEASDDVWHKWRN